MTITRPTLLVPDDDFDLQSFFNGVKDMVRSVHSLINLQVSSGVSDASLYNKIRLLLNQIQIVKDLGDMIGAKVTSSSASGTTSATVPAYYEYDANKSAIVVGVGMYYSSAWDVEWVNDDELLSTHDSMSDIIAATGHGLVDRTVYIVFRYIDDSTSDDSYHVVTNTNTSTVEARIVAQSLINALTLARPFTNVACDFINNFPQLANAKIVIDELYDDLEAVLP